MEPILRVTDPKMAVALRLGLRVIITSAIAGQVVGRASHVRREGFLDKGHFCHQALLK